MVCRRVGCVVWVFVALSGCAASSPPDAPVELGDAPPVMDAKPAADVSVMPTPDAAVRVDARLDAADAGAGPDAGTIVGSTQIAAVRQAAEGSIDLPVSGVKVTYLKPAVGDDAAGFFIQAEQVGPALFIQVDPQSLPGSVSVGDTVSFRAQSLKQNVNGILTVVTAVTSFAVTAQGGPGDVAALVQDVDGLNWDETIAASYESELIRVTGTLSEAFSISGGRHVQARVVPNGGTTTTAKIRVRMPDELRQAADVEIGCTIVLDASPLWLFKSGTNVTPQALAYQAGDLSLSGCPAPTVVKAYATALDTVQVMFSHQVDSATVNASKLTGGPSVSSAAVSGGNAHIVTVTLSQNAQAEMPYALTVAATVGDVHGKTLAAAPKHSSSASLRWHRSSSMRPTPTSPAAAAISSSSS